MINVLLWPFKMAWSFIGMLFKLMGSVLAAVVGIALSIAGIFLTLTVVGAIIGIPLLVVGVLLLVKSLF
ncbi:MAG: hypothetical protein ACK5LX_04220 [Oscillospiraceae bacterium]